VTVGEISLHGFDIGLQLISEEVKLKMLTVLDDVLQPEEGDQEHCKWKGRMVQRSKLVQPAIKVYCVQQHRIFFTGPSHFIVV